MDLLVVLVVVHVVDVDVDVVGEGEQVDGIVDAILNWCSE